MQIHFRSYYMIELLVTTQKVLSRRTNGVFDLDKQKLELFRQSEIVPSEDPQWLIIQLSN